MSATERLYFADPLLMQFTARVIAHGTWEKRPSAILDRTAFYPEAGGQMADRGRMVVVANGGASSGAQAAMIGGSDAAGVVDVQVDAAGRVHHLLAGPLPDVGAEIAGEIARDRRRVHMALHTGQHMLSRALADLAQAATVSSRLGETACTIDVDQEAVEERRIAAAEDLVNSVIDDDVAVRAFFPSDEELAKLPLRRAPKVTENIRVVAIGDFDVSPCGGTHCTRSAQVGLVHVTGVERYKGKIRVVFAAGGRARRELGAHAATLRTLGRELSLEALLVPQGVAKLREELAASRDALGKMRGRLAETIAERIAAAAAGRGRSSSEGGAHRGGAGEGGAHRGGAGEGGAHRGGAGEGGAHRGGADEGGVDRGAVRVPMVAVIDEASMELLRSIATRLTADGQAAAILGGRTAEGVNVLVTRGAASTFDCGGFLKRLAATAGGRGGGRKEHAEGKVPSGVDLEAAVRAVLAEQG